MTPESSIPGSCTCDSAPLENLAGVFGHPGVQTPHYDLDRIRDHLDVLSGLTVGKRGQTEIFVQHTAHTQRIRVAQDPTARARGS